MTTTEIILLALAAIFGVAVVYLLTRPKQDNKTGVDTITILQAQIQQLANSQNEKLDRTIQELNNRLSEQNKTIGEQMRESRVSLHQQLVMSQKASRDISDSTQKIVKEVTEKLVKLDETNKQVMGFAEQMQSLENILRNPKQRGVLGEYFLNSVLESVLPPDAFKLQYKFKNGEIVDGLIITRDKYIPIDAKFSLENYNRMATAETAEERVRFEKLFKSDLKGRVDETSKYIRPDESTYDFAFMFIPADGLYYELLVNKVGSLDAASSSLIEYAFKKRVIIVSPTTLFAYLQTVLQGLRALKIEESAKEIQANVAKLQKHLTSYEDSFRKLGDHLGRAASSYASASDEYHKIDKDVIRIVGAQEKIELATELLDTDSGA